MLFQEVTQWDTKRTKEKNRCNEGPGHIRELVGSIEKQIKQQLSKAPHRHMSRVKRELEIANQIGLIEDFNVERECLSMINEDGESTKKRYHDIRIFQISLSSHLTVVKEMFTSTLLNKFEQRLTGYTRSLVQALHDRDASVEAGNAKGVRLWNLQKAIANVVSRRPFKDEIVWPQSPDMVEVILTLELIEFQASTLCSVSENMFTEQLNELNNMYNILIKILMLIRDWPNEDEMDIIVTQWLRAFRSVLSSEYIASVDVHSSSVTCVNIALELAWWNRAMRNGKSNVFTPPQLFDRRFVHHMPSEFSAQSNIKKKPYGKKSDPFTELPPQIHEDGDGYYIALLSSYPDVFFASRSVAMQLVHEISKTRRKLKQNTQTHREETKVPAPLAKTGSISAAHTELMMQEKLKIEREADENFVKTATDVLERLILGSLELAQAVCIPLEDVFCSIRRLGVGDFRYLETGEKCITESLKIICCVFVICTSENAFGAMNSNEKNKRIIEDNIIEEGAIFSSAKSRLLLTKLVPLYKSNKNACIACIDNLPLQSSLLQTTSVMCIYFLQEHSRLIQRKKEASDELATLKPITKVLTDIFGATTAAPTAPLHDPNVESEQDVWDRVTAATKEIHHPTIDLLIEDISKSVKTLLNIMYRNKDIPSIQYWGFLNLRLIFRLPFLKPHALEELVADSVETYEAPDGGVGFQASASISGGPSLLLDGNSLSVLSISEWRGGHVLDSNGIYKFEEKRLNCRQLLSRVIFHTGESHASKLEVIEQWLLFIIHVSKCSLECVGILRELGIDAVMQRIVLLNRMSPYFTALSEIFFENMKPHTMS